MTDDKEYEYRLVLVVTMEDGTQFNQNTTDWYSSILKARGTQLTRTWKEENQDFYANASLSERVECRRVAGAPESFLPEFDSLEQELFKHQPVLSMRDGSIAGCQCLDRVFHKDAEDWGTHLAEVFESLRPAQTKPTDAQVERAARSIAEWNTSDVPLELCRAVARDALRAAFSVRDVKP